MDEVKLTSELAQEIASNVHFWVTIVGLLGVVIGSAITFLGNIFIHWIQSRKSNKLDEARKEILKKMLEDNRFKDKWRYLSTLSAVVGADEQTTMRLLIEIGGRGSEKGDGKWGFIKYHPFNEIEQ